MSDRVTQAIARGLAGFEFDKDNATEMKLVHRRVACYAMRELITILEEPGDLPIDGFEMQWQEGQPPKVSIGVLKPADYIQLELGIDTAALDEELNQKGHAP